jgi:hypothetical protein
MILLVILVVCIGTALGIYRLELNKLNAQFTFQISCAGAWRDLEGLEGIINIVEDMYHLVYAIQLLDNHGTRCTTTVANGRHTVLARLQLVKQSDENTRTGTSKSMAQRDSTAKHVHIGTLETENL